MVQGRLSSDLTNVVAHAAPTQAAGNSGSNIWPQIEALSTQAPKSLERNLRDRSDLTENAARDAGLSRWCAL
jgi:hypothetical protein